MNTDKFLQTLLDGALLFVIICITVGAIELVVWLGFKFYIDILEHL